MNQCVFRKEIVAGVLVALFFGIALYIRVALPYSHVFVGDWIKSTGNDAYFFMRLVDNLVHNFPHLTEFDPYALYPDGSPVNIRSFFVYLIAGVIWLISLGSPTQHLIDVVGVYFPAVLGALTVIPVYFIGKALFNRWAGVMAALLVGIFPGEFLGRSVLGFTDYHVAEVLFTTITMLFLILGVKNAKEKELTLKQVKDLNWAITVKPLIYSLLAGIFLGTYLLTWPGALLFVFIIFVYLIIQFIIDHLKNRSTDYLCFVSTITFIVASLMFLPTSANKMFLASLIIAIVIPVALVLLSHSISSRSMKPIIYPVILLGLGLVSLIALRIVSPSLLQAMVRSLGIFVWHPETTIFEMRPFLLPFGDFSWYIAWGNFNTSFFLSFIALGILFYSVIKRGDTDKTLFVVWSLVILAATLAMRRFAYYLVVNVALLTGYLSWLILEFAGFGKPLANNMTAPAETKKGDKGKKRKRNGSRPAANQVYMVLGVIFIFLLVFYPNIGPLPSGARPVIDTARRTPFAPSDAWCESLSWLRDNTPDPFGNPNFYYELHQRPSPGEGYEYPKAAYGVTAWWDYGYWITRIGRRIPTSNPGTSHRGEAYIFTAQDEDQAGKLLDDWDSKYIVVDYAIVSGWDGKFHALATESESNTGNFFDIYYLPEQGKLKAVRLYYPEYYCSFVVRLYNFDGGQVVPQRTIVVSYEQKINKDGRYYKEITSAKSFPRYEEAEAYVSSQESGNYRIVGDNPFFSPVPLEALEHYKLVYSSKGTKVKPDGGPISEVKIFEHLE